jgi:hypothetical protein
LYRGLRVVYTLPRICLRKLYLVNTEISKCPPLYRSKGIVWLV